jgi:hypothetical protein
MEYDIDIDPVGAKKYYKKGTRILHREGGPAVITAIGSLHWIVNGKRHRTDGPAIEYFNGDKVWWIDEKKHRVDGPAVERTNNDKEWWINDKRLSPEKEAILNQWRCNSNPISR